MVFISVSLCTCSFVPFISYCTITVCYFPCGGLCYLLLFSGFLGSSFVFVILLLLLSVFCVFFCSLWFFSFITSIRCSKDISISTGCSIYIRTYSIRSSITYSLCIGRCSRIING